MRKTTVLDVMRRLLQPKNMMVRSSSFFLYHTDRIADLYSSYMDTDPEPDPHAQNAAVCRKCEIVLGFCIICSVFKHAKK